MGRRRRHENNTVARSRINGFQGSSLLCEQRLTEQSKNTAGGQPMKIEIRSEPCCSSACSFFAVQTVFSLVPSNCQQFDLDRGVVCISWILSDPAKEVPSVWVHAKGMISSRFWCSLSANHARKMLSAHFGACMRWRRSSTVSLSKTFAISAFSL